MAELLETGDRSIPRDIGEHRSIWVTGYRIPEKCWRPCCVKVLGILIRGILEHKVSVPVGWVPDLSVEYLKFLVL